MTHVCLLTTTYNRPEALARLYASCATEAVAAGVRLTRCLVDDASNTPYALQAGVSLVHRQTVHHGRDGYWQTVTHLWELAQLVADVEVYCMLPDDVTWHAGGLASALAHWRSLTQYDPDAICLNVLVEGTRRHGPCWTGVPPALVRYGSHAVYRTQWVDGAFVCDGRFFEALTWQVRPVDHRRWRAASSGVGAQISHRLDTAGWQLYQMPVSLLAHGTAPSVMHPTIRQQEPMHA